MTRFSEFLARNRRGSMTVFPRRNSTFRANYHIDAVTYQGEGMTAEEAIRAVMKEYEEAMCQAPTS